MGYSNIALDDLVKVTLKVMVENNLTDLNNFKLTRSHSNIWHMISSKYFKNNEYRNAKNVYSWWQRNTKNYKRIINNLINEKEIQEKCNLIVHINYEDWIILLTYIGDYKRKKFRSEFDDFLSEKLQQKGLKCWLKCKYNWFRESTCSKINKEFWRGIFTCVDDNCLNEFEALINENIIEKRNETFDEILKKDFFVINVFFYEKTFHEEKIKRKQRCFGKYRKQQLNEILASGLTNCQSNNIIFNQIYSDRGNMIVNFINKNQTYASSHQVKSKSKSDLTWKKFKNQV